MRYDREWFLEAVRGRVGRAGTAFGVLDPGMLLGPDADAELSGLLRTTDPATDLEARHAAGLLCLVRAAAEPVERAAVHGAMAGTLMFPVWVADPGSVPPELAEHFAATDPATRPDPADADGPEIWWALCATAVILLEGRQHGPPPDASEETRRLHELAARTETDLRLPGALRVAAGIGGGFLSVLGTPPYDPVHDRRRRTLARALHLAELDWPWFDPTTDGSGVGGGQRAPSAHGRGGRGAGDGRGGREGAGGAGGREGRDGGARPQDVQHNAWDIDRADPDPVRHAHRALKAVPPASPERLLALAALGDRLRERYLESYDPEDLYEAVGIGRDLLAQLPPGGHGQVSALVSLGRALVLARQLDGATPDQCDEVVDLCRRAHDRHPQGPVPAGHGLATALLLRAQHTGGTADLDEAVAVLERAHPAARDDEQRATVSHGLANVLRARYLVTGDPADLERSAALSGVDSAAPRPESDGPSPLVAAMTLYTRYTRDPARHGADLDEALRRLRAIVTGLPTGHPDRPTALDDLGLVLLAHHQRSGSPAELNEAVQAFRDCVAATRPGHGTLGLRLLNLAAGLGQRHRLTDDGEDLREAQAYRRQVAGLPGTSPDLRAALLSSTGIGLTTGPERAADPVADLDGAVARLREAVALTSPGHPRLHQRRLNLAVALLSRMGHAERYEDLREVRELTAELLAALPAHAPERPGTLAVAAAARMLSPRALLSATARREAVALYREAVDLTPPGDPRRSQRLFGLAGLVHASARGRDRDRLVEAAGLFRQAAGEEQCPPFQRLEAARLQGDVLAGLGDWAGALDGYVTAVDLLPAVAPRHLVRDDQEFLLGRTVGLGAAAAACAVRCGRPGLAVGLLEQARGVLLSHAFDADSDLTRLRAADPALADRFERLRDAFDSATGGAEFLPEDPAPSPATGPIPQSASHVRFRDAFDSAT
ncbi:CHAT domain-containing protein, partial [Streptomyces sp. NPDC004610]|uniref:CHAT domain-containing protein n=2 Tax=Streptomyces TaxID=1883 RepID=UPI0033B9A4C6